MPTDKKAKTGTNSNFIVALLALLALLLPVTILTIAEYDIVIAFKPTINFSSESPSIRNITSPAPLTRLSTLPIQVLGSPGAGEGQFHYPEGVTQASGYLYVADTGNNRIQKFSVNGTFLKASLSSIQIHGGNGTLKGKDFVNFSKPADVSVDPFGNIYVADTGNNQIVKLDENFKPHTAWNSSNLTYLNKPSAISLDSSGDVYVADTGNNQIVKFNEEGEFLAYLDNETLDLSSPHDISVDAFGNVYVADTGNNQIVKLDENFNLVKSWNKNNTFPSLNKPRGVTVDSSGNIYVANTGNNQIVKFDVNGTAIESLGTSGSGKGQFKGPMGITINFSDNLYVADTGNNRIQGFKQGPVTVSNQTGNAVQEAEKHL